MTDTCFNEDLSKPLCCDCNFMGCWAQDYSPARCCDRDSWASEQTALILSRNRSWVDAQVLFCQALNVDRCAEREAFLTDPVCQALATYVERLPTACLNELSVTSCLKGLVLIRWNTILYARARRSPGWEEMENSSLQCSVILRDLRSDYKRLDIVEKENMPWAFRPFWFETRYVSMLRRCVDIRKHELYTLLPRAAYAFSTAALQEERLWVRERPRIGVILAMTKKEAHFYGHALGIWRCYCARHGDCEIVVEWENFLKYGDYPANYAVDYYTQEFSMKRGFAWNRWFALQRHLDAYEWVFTADPDQFISRQCFTSYSLSDALQASGALDPAGSTLPPVLVMRDFPTFQTLNSAGVFLRGGEAGRLFLSLLIGRLHWKGFADFDQSSFDQTVIEFLDLWHHVKAQKLQSTSGKKPRFRDNIDFMSAECLKKQYAWLDGSNVLEMYNECWHAFVARMFGAFGARTVPEDAPICFLNPEQVDINYVVGLRPQDDEPLVWHLAGKHKFVRDVNGEVYMDTLLKRFWNLSNETLPPRSPEPLGAGQEPNCSAWEAVAAAPGNCSPGTPIVDCRQGWLAVC
eukprot:TRINITY_DN11963_c0_g1_i1.p1 TRINITY_DN11963_c0_g1~~TRINITY_DN11963_c0_g1_i1.p1  ORF type:complete len:630 (+),score=80.00 TRINITY_DN11963_c0_g1_i1:160-1890(+)